MIHLGVLAAAALWLPIGVMSMQLPAGAVPEIWVPWLFGASIGPLFFAVSAQAPLLQRWFSTSSGGSDPYALYAASNLGSFAGLLAYPLIVEPQLALNGQSLLWTAGYALVAILVAGCALMLPRGAAAVRDRVTSLAPTWRRVGYWTALSFVPSGLMLATSTYLTTDIVAMPLLWVVPLGLYLLSFSIAFATNRAIADALTRIAPFAILLFGGVMVGGYQDRPYLNAALALLLLFLAAVALHTALYRSRPEPDRLTGFYLTMSFGGALGGVFAGLIAPVIFDWTWEFPILILAAGALVPLTFTLRATETLWRGDATRARIALLAIALVAALLVAVTMAASGGSLSSGQQGLAFAAIALVGVIAIGKRSAFLIVLVGALIVFGGYRSLRISLDGSRVRSYFGVYTLRDGVRERQLAHGTTVHGLQLTGSEARERTPTTYYVPRSGVGLAMQSLGPTARVGVVGLGSGTLACYARPGQSWRFFEIDPLVVRLASDPTKFTFLSRCLPGADIAIGDARLRLVEQGSASLDLLALDAFSSDSVPMHLMTKEAFGEYARVLAPDGLLLVHISNRFLDLRPVVSAAALSDGWSAAELGYRPDFDAIAAGETVSAWILLSKDRRALRKLARASDGWRPLPRYPNFAAWTDDYSSTLPLLKTR
jgi:SAM-dependent methyltransferase